MSGLSGKLGRLGLGGLGERVKSLRRGSRSAAGDGDGGAAGAAADGWGLPAPVGVPHPASGILVRSAPATSEEEAEAALRELASGYFDPPAAFDALEHELRQLPVDFTHEQQEAVAEERTSVLEVRRGGGRSGWGVQGTLVKLWVLARRRLSGAGAPPPPCCRPWHAPAAPPPSCPHNPPQLQVVSEKLSAHVIANYEQFVAGVDEVTQARWVWGRGGWYCCPRLPSGVCGMPAARGAAVKVSAGLPALAQKAAPCFPLACAGGGAAAGGAPVGQAGARGAGAGAARGALEEEGWLAAAECRTLHGGSAAAVRMLIGRASCTPNQLQVASNLRIAKDTRRKQGLSALLEASWCRRQPQRTLPSALRAVLQRIAPASLHLCTSCPLAAQVLLKLQAANNLQRALKWVPASPLLLPPPPVLLLPYSAPSNDATSCLS